MKKTISLFLIIFTCSLTFSQTTYYRDAFYRSWYKGKVEAKYKKGKFIDYWDGPNAGFGTKVKGYLPVGPAKYYRPNGTLAIEGTWHKSGLAEDGIWKRYDDKGHLYIMEEFNLGIVMSRTEFYENGNIKKKEILNIKGLDPEEISKNKDKLLCYNVEFFDENEVLVGKWKAIPYYSKYDLPENASNDRLGIAEFYYKNNTLKVRITYKDTNVESELGEIKKEEYFYENGKKRLEIEGDEMIAFDRQGNPSEIIFYDRDLEITEYKWNAEYYRIYNPNENGTCRWIGKYHMKSHKLQSEGFFKHIDKKDKSKTKKCQGIAFEYFTDKRETKWIKNYQNKTKTKGKYNNQEKKVGTWTHFYKNGIKKVVQEYKYGEVWRIWECYDLQGNQTMSDGNGIYLVYNKNDNIEFEAEFSNGQRNGVAKWYYENGQLSESAIYKKDESLDNTGLRWEILSSYNKNGQPREKGTLKNGYGTWINYNNYGRIISVSRFKDGKSIE